MGTSINESARGALIAIAATAFMLLTLDVSDTVKTALRFFIVTATVTTIATLLVVRNFVANSMKEEDQ